MNAYREFTCPCGSEVIVRPVSETAWQGLCPHCGRRHTWEPASEGIPDEGATYRLVIYREEWNETRKCWMHSPEARYAKDFADRDEAIQAFREKYRPIGNGGIRFDGGLFIENGGRSEILLPKYKAGRVSI